MRTKIVLWACMFLLAAAIPAFPQVQDPPKEAPKDVNITGVWAFTVSTPQGEMTNDATFTQEKEVLKVVMTGPQGEPMNGQGTVKGAVAEWTVTISTPNGDFTIAFKGKIDGETMGGEIQMGDFGTAAWSAKKKKQ
jgi:hypothetical protein